jgi:hypothetical protein
MRTAAGAVGVTAGAIEVEAPVGAHGVDEAVAVTGNPVRPPGVAFGLFAGPGPTAAGQIGVAVGGSGRSERAA